MPSIQRHEEPKGRDPRRAVLGRLQLWLAALAVAQGAWAAPAVSGDGACGIRAVDDEAMPAGTVFLQCRPADADRVASARH